MRLLRSHSIYKKCVDTYAFMEGEFYQHNFVGNIPFLYNGVTASRLDRRYGLATLGLTFQGF